MNRATRTLIFALAASGCQPSPPPAAEQDEGKLAVPSFQLSADPVQNGGLAPEMVYRGSVLIFDPTATPEQLGTIIEGTRRTRVTKANWLRAERHDVAPLTERLAGIRQAITNVEAEARQDDNLRAAQEATSRVWLARQLDGERLAGPARERADAVWAAYCEAKVWELALTPRVVTDHYDVRPTPLQLCEDVYAARGLLAGSACAPATKRVGKNYFSCLWRDGVMKTALYQDRYDAPFPDAPGVTKAQKLAALIDDGDLAASLIDDSRAHRVVSAAIGLDTLRFASVFGREYKELFIPATGTPADAPDLPLADASPALLIAAIEDGTTAVSATALHWLPDAPWSVNLTRSLKEMGARPLDDLSVSDYLFQRLAAGAVRLPPRDLPVVKKNPDFAYIFDAIGPAFAARIAALKDELAAVTEARDAASAGALNLFDAFTTQMGAAAAAASLNGNNASLWVNAVLRVKRLPEGVVETRFSLDDVTGVLHRACFQHPGAGVVACPAEFGLIESPMEITHDPATGGLTLITPMDQHHLKMVLYPNQIDDVLYYYSGQLTISDGDSVLHEGGLNLMTD